MREMTVPITREEWNSAVVQRGGSFLQSFEWGEVQERFGRRVSRIATEDIVGQVIEHRLPGKMRYGYVPRGPLPHDVESYAAEKPFVSWCRGGKQFVERAKAAHSGIVFLRVEPAVSSGSPFIFWALRRNRFRSTRISIQPQQNLVLDVSPPLEGILQAMHEKTRYNIRLSQRHGVECASVSRNNITTFLDLLKETAIKQKIRLHPDEYYRTLLDILPDLPDSNFQIPDSRFMKRLYIASLKGKALATVLVGYFGKRATYLHGGTAEEQRKSMAPYALHWRIMQDAKAAGFTEYDMGGIDEKRWPGITRFKKGFGGYSEAYAPAYDYAYDTMRYSLYRIARHIFR